MRTSYKKGPDIYMGLWFPVIVTGLAPRITLLFWPETKDRDIHAES